MNSYIQSHTEDFTQAIDFFEKDISSLRTGRANPSMLDNIEVEAYGSKMALNAVGNISISDGRSIVITPWDKTVLKDIEKAIVAADLGLGVVNEGELVRISIPLLTEENRKELVKKLNGKMEEARIVIRQIRDDIKQSIEKAFDEKEMSEDDKFRFIKELEEVVHSHNESLKLTRDRKEKDIMTI
jgi:ribosome recycling factor